MNVFNKDLWTAGEYIYNHFIEGVDKDCFLAPDRINAAQVCFGIWYIIKTIILACFQEPPILILLEF